MREIPLPVLQSANVPGNSAAYEVPLLMKSLLIVNPAAGQGRPSESLDALHSALDALVGGVVITQKPGDAEAAAREAGDGRMYDAVLVAGGDGTVNEVVNGLLSSGSALPLGLIPLGTQNVLAHELGLPSAASLTDTAAMLRRGKMRAIDIGRAGDRYFALMAGFGFDAQVVREVLRPVKDLLGPAAYAFATLGALARCHSSSLTLTLDDEEIRSEAYLVVIANAASYAYGQIKLAPFAALDDGWLDVCVFEKAPSRRFGFAGQLMAVLARRHLRDPRVRYYRARRIKIDSDPPIQGQLDGETHGSSPLEITLLPQALSLFVP